MEDSSTVLTGPENKIESSQWSIVALIVGIAIFLAGVFFAFSVANRIDESNRANLLTRVQTIAYLTDSTGLSSFSGTSEDLNSPQYQEVKNTLLSLRNVNHDARFIYYMRSNGSKLFFLADSELPGSKDYSPPGEVYGDTSAIELSNYNNQVSFTEGPYVDEWGTWVSAYAPVHTIDGQYVGIVGMDVDAHEWRSEIVSVGVSIFVTGLIISALFILLSLYLRRSEVAVRLSFRVNNYLTKEKKHAESIVARAGIGEWTLTPKTGAVVFNDAMYELAGIDKNTPVDLEQFTNAMTLEGKKEFDNTFADASSKTQHEFTCVVLFKTGKKLRISAVVHYGTGLEPVRVSGFARI